MTIYLWVSLGDASAPPQRVQVETCHDCSALVPVAAFDTHGHFHRDLERLPVIAER